MLRIFPMNLGGQTLDWYNNLGQYSLLTFQQLVNIFLNHFLIYIKSKITLNYLYNLNQYQDELIIDYVTCWRTIVHELTFLVPYAELNHLFAIYVMLNTF